MMKARDWWALSRHGWTQQVSLRQQSRLDTKHLVMDPGDQIAGIGGEWIARTHRWHPAALLWSALKQRLDARAVVGASTGGLKWCARAKSTTLLLCFETLL